MQTPVPFGIETLNNSPLEDAFPGDYPCKQRDGVYDVSVMNFMEAGTTQQLSFEGTASHGGGTCQLAVSRDPEPTAESIFKIIQVYEGGCPISSEGNTGTHPFTFQIPKGFPNGRATFAWYWNNRIGNREAFMNCAPITVIGGSEDLDVFDALPSLFLANLPSSDCSIEEGSSLKVPNPGAFLLQNHDAPVRFPSGPKCKEYSASQVAGMSPYDFQTQTNLASYAAPVTNALSMSHMTSSDGLDRLTASSPLTSAVAVTMNETLAAGICNSAGTDLFCSLDGRQFGVCIWNGTIVWRDVALGQHCKNRRIA